MTGPTDHHTTDLREYLRVLRARKFEILLVTVVVVVAVLFFSFRSTPMYEGSAWVLVKPIQNVSSTFSVPVNPNLDTERKLVLSQSVAATVKRDTGTPLSTNALLGNLGVQVVTDTEVLVIGYVDPQPAVAAQFANAFADAYVAFRSEQILDQYEAASAAIQQRIDGVQLSLQDLNRRIDNARNQETRDNLRAQRDTALAQLGVLNQRLLDLQANASAVQSAAEVVQRATVPTSPASPNKARDAALALLGGLALGIGVAFVRERLDDRVKSRHELERRLGAPVLAAVPRVGAWRKPEDTHLVMLVEPKSPVSEAYRTLGTNVQYLASQSALKVIMVTSAIGGDGKSTSCANLAVVLAQAGKRVILVSADLRRPRIHHFFGMDNERGLTDVLADTTPLTEVAKDPGVRNLRLVNAGPVPPDPAALLGSRRSVELVESLRAAADFVIVDTPPVLAVADASILAPLVDGTIFVLDAQHSSRSALVQARDQLENAGARIIGALYNNFDPTGGDAYPYYYYYHYYYQYAGLDERSTNGNGRPPRRRGRRPKWERAAEPRGEAARDEPEALTPAEPGS